MLRAFACLLILAAACGGSDAPAVDRSAPPPQASRADSTAGTISNEPMARDTIPDTSRTVP